MNAKGVIRNFVAQLDSRRLSAADSFFHPDCKFFLPGSHEAADCDQFKLFVGMLYAAFPDLRHTIVEQIGEGDDVVTLLRVRGTHLGLFFGIPPTGKEIVFTDIMITRLQEGRVIELNAQFDALSVLTDLGALGTVNQK